MFGEQHLILFLYICETVKPINVRDMNINNIMADLERRHPGEKEYLQAVREVLISVEPIYNQHPEFEDAKIVERPNLYLQGAMDR